MLFQHWTNLFKYCINNNKKKNITKGLRRCTRPYLHIIHRLDGADASMHPMQVYSA